jgi:hypothetical protein
MKILVYCSVMRGSGQQDPSHPTSALAVKPDYQGGDSRIANINLLKSRPV